MTVTEEWFAKDNVPVADFVFANIDDVNMRVLLQIIICGHEFYDIRRFLNSSDVDAVKAIEDTNEKINLIFKVTKSEDLMHPNYLSRH